MYSSGRQNEKATTSRKRLRKDKECNRVQKAEDIAEYKGSWPLEKLVDYINNSHLKQLSQMTEAGDASVEPASGELKDRSRKVRKKFSRKDPSSSEAQSSAEQSNTRLVLGSSGHRCELEDASEAQENNASDDPCLLEQLEDVIFRSLRNGDSAHSPSDFVTSKSSSSSDLDEFLFFDDLSATAKEEEFKVVQRKKKTKANELQDKEQIMANKNNNKKRINKLEKCKEFIEKQVVVSKVIKPILTNGLKSFDSFSNSVSVSTFASLSSSVRSSSPVSTSDRDDSVMCELPITTADVAGVLNDKKLDFCFIPGVTSCTNLGNELDNRGSRPKSTDERIICDLVPSVKIATADGKLSFCRNLNGQYASPQMSSVFVSDPGYPDIVTSTISEFPVSRSLEAFRWIPDVKPNISLPQPDDITEHSVNYSCLFQSGSTLSDGHSRSTLESKDAIVFGDFSSSELKPQDNSYCDTKSTAPQMNFEFPMSYSRLRSSRCQIRAKLRHEVVALKTKDSGMCSNPVIFVNCIAKGACDPEISFGFDSVEDEEDCDIRASDGFVKTDVSTGDYQWGNCLPDLVDPAVVLHSSNLVTEFASGTATCFDVCNAYQSYDVLSLKRDSKSSFLNSVDCQASACTDSSTTVPCNDASSQSYFRLPTKVGNSAMKTLEKSYISSKWNKHPETAWANRNGHESWYDRRGGFRTKENANHGHLTTGPSENPRKKLTIINGWKHRAGKFDLYTTQAFLWRSECNLVIYYVITFLCYIII